MTYTHKKHSFMSWSRLGLLVLLTTLCLLPDQADAQARTYRKSYGRNYGGSSRGVVTSRSDYYHFIYLSGLAGYTSMQEGLRDIQPVGGPAYGLGLGYEFRNNNFWLSIGAQLQRSHHKANILPYTYDYSTLVYEGGIPNYGGSSGSGQQMNLEMVGHYRVSQRDTMTLNMIEIPLLLGYYYNGFYVGVGPKVSFGLNPTVTTTGHYVLTGTEINGRYTDDLNLGESDFHTEQQTTLAPLVSICGEIGYDLLASLTTRSAYCNVLKLGFYFECGVNSMFRPSQDGQRMVGKNGSTDLNGLSALDVQFNPYYSSALKNKQRVAPFFTGIKLTYMFGGSNHSNHGVRHTGCQCYGL